MMTPFHLAAESGHHEVVAHLLHLLAQQADPQRKQKAMDLRRGSALFLAQQGEHATVVGLLTAANQEQ